MPERQQRLLGVQRVRGGDHDRLDVVGGHQRLDALGHPLDAVLGRERLGRPGPRAGHRDEPAALGRERAGVLGGDRAVAEQADVHGPGASTPMPVSW